MRWSDLSEAPIDIAYRKIGDGGSHYPDDAKLAQNAKGIRKSQKLWRNSIVDFNVIILDLASSPEKAYSDAFGAKFALPKKPTFDANEEPARVMMQHYGLNPAMLRPDCINIIYTNNMGDQRIPLTGWMIAHRFYHAYQMTSDAVRTSPMGLALGHVLESIIGSYETDDGTIPSAGLAAAVMCPSRAGREFKLGNPSEIIPELFARYLLTGKTDVSLPDMELDTPFGKFVCRTQDEHEEICFAIDWFEDQVKAIFPRIVEQARGRLFIS